MNNIDKKTPPAIITKAWMCEIFGFTRSYDLIKKGIFTKQWLEVLGMDKAYYNKAIALKSLGHYRDAMNQYDIAIKLKSLSYSLCKL